MKMLAYFLAIVDRRRDVLCVAGGSLPTFMPGYVLVSRCYADGCLQ